jgi:hypothetical protein
MQGNIRGQMPCSPHGEEIRNFSTKRKREDKLIQHIQLFLKAIWILSRYLLIFASMLIDGDFHKSLIFWSNILKSLHIK